MINYPKGKSLGAEVQNFPKEQYAWAKEVTDAINDLNDGSFEVDGITAPVVA